MHAFAFQHLLNVLVAVKILAQKQAIWYGGGRGSIPYIIGAHVLENDLAVVVGVRARMLIGPLH